MIVAGLNADGFGRDNWVAGGKQGLFEQDNFTSPAYVARIDYKGVPGLRVGTSIYYCNDVTANADKPYKYSSVGRSAVMIYSADAQYKNKYVTARGNIIYGTVDNSDKISAVTLSNNSSYYHGAMRNVAKAALCYGVEAGVNVSAFAASKSARWFIHMFVMNIIIHRKKEKALPLWRNVARSVSGQPDLTGSLCRIWL